MIAFQQLMSTFGVLYAIETSPDGTLWTEHGRKEDVPYKGILLRYFPGPQGMPALNEFLNGQILPKTIMQGQLMCVISKPRDDRIFGLFVMSDSGLDVPTRMELGRTIDKELSDLLARTA